MVRIVDLSVTLEAGIASDPARNLPEIAYTDHDAGAEKLASSFPGLRRDQLPDGKGWAVERLNVSTHNGTHMDAPWHFHPTQDAALAGGSRRALTIDEIPLEWCMKPGVKFDFRHFPNGYVVTADDVERELARIEHQIQPFDIVLVNTSAGVRYGFDDYVHTGCGMGREATLYLASRGVKVVGTDGWSWDAPFVYTNERWQRDGDPSIIWEGHKAGREIGYFQIEKLHNLEALPPKGFTVCCFPFKIKAASAGFVRAVALLEQDGPDGGPVTGAV